MCCTRVIQQLCCAARKLHVSAWCNIIIQSSIHESDALVKCITRKLRMYHLLHVNCMHGHLWIILPLILCDVHSILGVNYKHLNHSTTTSITAVIVHFCFLPSQSKRNSSEHMLQDYLISAGAPNVSKIPDNTGRWLYSAYITKY